MAGRRASAQDRWSWSDDELAVLTANYARGDSVWTSGRILHRTERAVRSMEYFLGLRRSYER